MYSEERGTMTAEDDTTFKVTIKHVDISPDVAKTVFDRGLETGDWGWKSKWWLCSSRVELKQTIAAARYFYGWKDGSEEILKCDSGDYIYKAHYAC
jgi:hypothetical protein